MESITIEGVVKNIRYHSEDTGFTIFTIICEDETITCTANIAELSESETVSLTGVFVVHKTYGEQFKATVCHKQIPATSDNIEKYLSSGMMKGIGPKLAQRIVSKFGDKTFDVIENNFIELTKIRGISKRIAAQINETFNQFNKTRNTMLFLQDLDITPAYIAKIQKKYGDDTINALQINPYRLADEISGIGFKKADVIAERIGIKRDSPYRVQAAIKYSLARASDNGHVYLPKQILIRDVVQLVEQPYEMVEEHLNELQLKSVVRQEKLHGDIVVYLNFYFHMENYVAKKLLLLNNKLPINKVSLPRNNLSLQQIDAVKEAISNGVTVITGGPGTGKTTTLNVIIKTLRHNGYCIELAAPTGRAAKRMSEATNNEAKTIHRLLGINFATGLESFMHDEDNPIIADYIIIDEASMIDISLMYHLLKAVSINTRLILVGDVDQLPSVGPGNVLRDIIQSERIQVVRLTEIFRQAQQSSIVVNAHKINNGENLMLTNNDFFFVQKDDADSIIDVLMEFVTNRIPKKLKLDNAYDIQVMSAVKKTDIGTFNLNKILQAKLNPPSQTKNEKQFGFITFREGDKVMQMKNNYSLEWSSFQNDVCVSKGTGVFNGDDGIIQSIDNVNAKMIVKFDDRIVEYLFTQLDELDLSYAITIHKSQGSEYKAVVIPIFNTIPMLMTRNLLYTAVTRAKDLVIIIGLNKTVYSMIHNRNKSERYSALTHRITQLDRLKE